jgi:glutathione S-transferase
MIMATNTAEKTSLEIKRFINAPRDCVYAAWTDPAQLKEWFGPENVRTRNFTADARVGGKYRWDLINEEGDDMTISGEYRELVPGKKIVFTWKWDDDEAWKYTSSVVTVELSDRDSGTELRLIHEKLPSEESRDRHNEGWNSVVDRLEKFFSK